MKNTKLIKLLKTFSESDVKRFRDFVNSPFYNKNKHIIKLYEVLMKFHPSFDSPAMEEKKIFHKMFADESYDYFKLKNISSDLYSLGLEYLKTLPNIITRFCDDYNMITQLRMRKLWTYHRKIVQNYEKAFKDEKIRDSIFLYNNHLLITESHFSHVLVQPNSIKMIQAEFNSFFDYSILNMMKFYSLMMHISKENNVTMDMKMFDEVVSYLEKNETGDNPSISIYRYIILLTIKRKEEYYFLLKKKYFNDFDKLSYEDAYYAHMYIFGYCMDMYNLNGDRRFIKECYDLFKHTYLSNRVTLGEMFYPDFINYIKVFTRQGDTLLAEKFVKDFRDKLIEDQRENTLNFSEALIAYNKGKLEQALSLASKVNFQWIILKIQVRILQLEIYYELGYYEESRELIESFKKMVTREPGISELYRKSMLDFLKCTLSLLNLVQNSDSRERKFGLSMLQNEVSRTLHNHFGVKFWLEDRLAEVK